MRSAEDPTGDDLALVDDYDQWGDKGPVVDGRRVSILSRRRVYTPDEPVRVVHVVEAVEPGHDVYAMGPKPVADEYVDDVRRGPTDDSTDADPFVPLDYDGRVIESPAVDTNYETTVHSFARPGVYEISWRPGRWRSNTLTIEVVAPGPHGRRR